MSGSLMGKWGLNFSFHLCLDFPFGPPALRVSNPLVLENGVGVGSFLRLCRRLGVGDQGQVRFPLPLLPNFPESLGSALGLCGFSVKGKE